MNIRHVPKSVAVIAAAVSLVACSGPTEDVRVTFCKDVSSALAPGAESIEWTANENTFRRPEYATAKLTFEVVDGGERKTMQTACYFAYDAIEDTAQHLADPFSAYATLPFAMSVDGRALSDAEVMRLRNNEQIRRGNAAIETLETNARDLANKVRASLAQ